jgi:hypothetical protein
MFIKYEYLPIYLNYYRKIFVTFLPKSPMDFNVVYHTDLASVWQDEHLWDMYFADVQN